MWIFENACVLKNRLGSRYRKNIYHPRMPPRLQIIRISFFIILIGQDGGTRTHDPKTPSLVRYQLRHILICWVYWYFYFFKQNIRSIARYSIFENPALFRHPRTNFPFRRRENADPRIQVKTNKSIKGTSWIFDLDPGSRTAHASLARDDAATYFVFFKRDTWNFVSDFFVLTGASFVQISLKTSRDVLLASTLIPSWWLK